jgi:hypothetical protein
MSCVRFRARPTQTHVHQAHFPLPPPPSQLTRLLEDSLGNSAKCVMVVNVSPAMSSAQESRCSLEFAARARKVELGRARQNSSSLSTPPPDPPQPPRRASCAGEVGGGGGGVSGAGSIAGRVSTPPTAGAWGRGGNSPSAIPTPPLSARSRS